MITMKMKQCLSFILLLCFLISCTNSETPEQIGEAKQTKSLNAPSLETQIGQMIMAGFRGFTLDEVSPSFLQQIEAGYLGGVILFDYDVVKKKAERNIQSPQQVQQLITDIKSKASTPLFVAVDQEGGRVNRLKTKYGFPASVSAKYLGILNNLDSTRHYAFKSAQNLKALGFNVNFAPVVDIDLNPDNPVIGQIERSFSSQTEAVIRHGTAYVQMQDSLGIISTLKHFPGHGSAASDSHKGVTDITNHWSREELLPFQAISAASPSVAIMTAHVMNHTIDSVYPATMSRQVIHDILREELNFSGLVFSDDLQMKAVNAMYPFETIILKAINAGVDVLVVGNNLEYDEQAPQKAVKIITRLVKEGKISRARIQTSYDRIMRYKKRMNQ